MDVAANSKTAPPRRLAARSLTRRVVHLRDLLVALVGRDLKVRYKRSVLGIAWSLVNPLAQLLVFVFVFGQVLSLDGPRYPAMVFSGVLAWSWFSASITQGAGAIVENRQLIRRPGFPSAILPVVAVTTNLIHFLLALPVLLVFSLIDGSHFGWSILLLPVVVGVEALLILGITYVVAMLQVTFRDTAHLTGLVLMMLMYVTPVFYDPSIVPAQYRAIYNLNPMVHIIGAFREIIVHGAVPSLAPLAAVGLAGLVLLGLGYGMFARARVGFVEEL
jgi:lipopolysaccharide transport system permease protein